MMRDILASPRAIQSVALKLACLLCDMPNTRSGVDIAAGKLKISAFTIEECVTHNPRLFQLDAKARFICLSTPGNAPDAESPAQQKARLDEERKRTAALAKQMARIAEDERDTPYNRLWKRIEAIGMDQNGAKGLAKRLISTYPDRYIEIGLKAGEDADPSNIPSYVIAAIKRAMEATPPTQRAKTVPARTPRTGRHTVRIGWDHALHNGIRHILFRTPEGTVSRVPPKAGEHVPSFSDDPGYEVR